MGISYKIQKFLNFKKQMRTEQDDLDSVALLGNKRADRANSSGNGSIFCHMVQCLSSLSVLVLLAACVTMVALTFKNVLDVKQVQNQQEQVACSFAILASHQPLAEAVQKNQLPCARQILREYEINLFYFCIAMVKP